MKTLSQKQQYILDALETGVPAIVSTSQYIPIQYNPESLRVIYGGSAPAVRGLAQRGLVEYKQQWCCAIVTKK